MGQEGHRLPAAPLCLPPPDGPWLLGLSKDLRPLPCAPCPGVVRIARLAKGVRVRAAGGCVLPFLAERARQARLGLHMHPEAASCAPQAPVLCWCWKGSQCVRVRVPSLTCVAPRPQVPEIVSVLRSKLQETREEYILQAAQHSVHLLASQHCAAVVTSLLGSPLPFDRYLAPAGCAGSACSQPFLHSVSQLGPCGAPATIWSNPSSSWKGPPT